MQRGFPIQKHLQGGRGRALLRSRGQRSLILACFGFSCDIVTLRSMARKDVLLLGRCQVLEPTSCLWQSMRRREEPWATGAFRMCWPFPCRLLFRRNFAV